MGGRDDHGGALHFAERPERGPLVLQRRRTASLAGAMLASASSGRTSIVGLHGEHHYGEVRDVRGREAITAAIAHAVVPAGVRA